MAPRRLIPKNVRGMAGAHTPPTLRFRVIARTPTVFIDYLFEALLAGMSTLIGLSYLTGFLSPGAVIQLLPNAVAVIFSWLMIVASGTVVIGLHLKRYGTVVSSGLKLLVFGYLTYTTSVVWYIGLRSALSVILMSLVFTALAAWRSFILHSTHILLSARGTKNEVTRKD